MIGLFLCTHRCFVPLIASPDDVVSDVEGFHIDVLYFVGDDFFLLS
jgi:hypothetical protein